LAKNMEIVVIADSFYYIIKKRLYMLCYLHYWDVDPYMSMTYPFI